MRNSQMSSCMVCMPFQNPRSKRKASKCKKMIKQVLYRLKLLQARKTTIVSQTSEDIAKLLQLGYFQRASNLVEEVYKERCRASAYKLIAELSECVSNNVPFIFRNRDITLMPVDVKTAVSSLIFAASRCGELPELNTLRTLFRNWYGNEFDATNVNFLPTNLVKPELKTILSPGSISNDVKLQLINDITKEYAVIRCRPINCQQVYYIHEEQYEYHQEHEWLNNEKGFLKIQKKPKSGYTSNTASNEDDSSRESTESTLQNQDKDIIVYLDDNKEKPVQQSYWDYEAATLSQNVKGVEKRTTLSRLSATSREPSKKEMQQNKKRESTGFFERDGRHGTGYSLGHVHPKLPYYDELQVKFKHPSGSSITKGRKAN